MKMYGYSLEQILDFTEEQAANLMCYTVYENVLQGKWDLSFALSLTPAQRQAINWGDLRICIASEIEDPQAVEQTLLSLNQKEINALANFTTQRKIRRGELLLNDVLKAANSDIAPPAGSMKLSNPKFGFFKPAPAAPQPSFEEEQFYTSRRMSP